MTSSREHIEMQNRSWGKLVGSGSALRPAHGQADDVVLSSVESFRIPRGRFLPTRRRFGFGAFYSSFSAPRCFQIRAQFGQYVLPDDLSNTAHIQQFLFVCAGFDESQLSEGNEAWDSQTQTMRCKK